MRPDRRLAARRLWGLGALALAWPAGHGLHHLYQTHWGQAGRWPKPLPVRDLSSNVSTLYGEGKSHRLVNFWAMWCPPCREELPALVRLQQDWAARGLEVLGVALDTDRYAVRDYVAKAAPGFQTWLVDPAEPALEAFGVKTLPHTWLLAPDGRVLKRWTGAAAWDDEAVRALLVF